MKIIILSPSNSRIGGVERFCEYLKNVYEDAKHEVIIFNDGSRSIFAKIFSKIGLWAPYIGWKLGNLAKKEGFDLLITNGLLGWNIKSDNIINIEHGTFAASADRIDKGKNYIKWFIKKYIWGYFEMLAVKHAKVVVGVSEDTKKSICKYYGRRDVIVINNSIDFSIFEKKDKTISRKKFSLSENQKLLLIVGRFEYAKGSDILMKLIQMLPEGYKLVITSNEKINHTRIISITTTYAELPFLYSACDFFIFPSRHEGSSLALIEAMACEMPILTTNVGSVIDICNSNPFFRNRVFPLNDFAQNSLNVILDSKDYKQEGKNNREIAKTLFSSADFNKKYLNLLDL